MQLDLDYKTPATEILTEYYYPRAKWLQNNCNWGDKSYTCHDADVNVNDKLMQSVDIYDCFTRDAAGFSNVPQDLWYGSSTPKFLKMSEDRKQVCLDNEGYDRTVEQWLYMFMVHRITGSGASFEDDHGYRNSLVQDWGQLVEIDDMRDSIRERKASGKPLFTSIGNQPPAPRKGVSNVDFMVDELPQLIRMLVDWFDTLGREATHMEIVDFLNDYNLKVGHRRFNFAYAAFSMDVSDYFPNLCNEWSHTYLGNNAARCAKTVANVGQNQHEYFMTWMAGVTGGKPKDLEDVLCDFVRFGQHYVPRGNGTFDHVPLNITNNSGWDSGWELRNGS